MAVAPLKASFTYCALKQLNRMDMWISITKLFYGDNYSHKDLHIELSTAS